MAGPNRLTDQASIAARTIVQHEMLQQTSKVLVAFSGGPDSTALMLILRELGYPLHLCHVDHQMRGESIQDAAHCVAVAEGLDIGITVRRAEPPVSTEAAARKVRYEILEDVAKEISADVIATGHTKDDQAETVRLRLDRGGFGLGIPPKRGKIIRPIIELRRADSLGVCESAGIPFVLDRSNTDLRYARNRVRRELEGDPQQAEVLLNIGAQASEAAQRSSKRLQEVIGTTIFFEDDGAVIDRSWILGLNADDARMFVSQTIRELGAELRGATVGKVGEILAATGKRMDLGGGLTAWTDPKWLRLGVLEGPMDMLEVELNVPGTTPWGQSVLTFQIHPISPAREQVGEVLDFELTGPRLWARQWEAGDRFRPLGSGEKKLQDFFVDEKVPRWERARIPVVHNGTDIVWIAGLRISEDFKVTGSTESFLSASVEPR